MTTTIDCSDWESHSHQPAGRWTSEDGQGSVDMTGSTVGEAVGELLRQCGSHEELWEIMSGRIEVTATKSYDQQWADGNSDGRGYAVGGADQDPSDLGEELGELIQEGGHSGSVAVYRRPCGGLVAVGDSHGPWAVDVQEVTL